MFTDLRLKFKYLLRQHVDLRVLLVDLFRELLKLRRLTRGLVRTRRERLRKTKSCERNENQSAQTPSGQQFHGISILALAALPGKQARCGGGSLPSYLFSLNFSHAGA